MLKPSQYSNRLFKFIDTHGLDYSVCWEWLGRVTSFLPPRGRFRYRGYTISVPRAIHILCIGDVDNTTEIVQQTCGNTLCCNPFHLIKERRDNPSKQWGSRIGFSTYALKHILNETIAGRTYEEIARSVRERYDITISPNYVGKIARGDYKKRRVAELTRDREHRVKRKDNV